MELTIKTAPKLIVALQERYPDYITDYASEYGEPGYMFPLNAEHPVILLGNWNYMERHQRVINALERAGVQFEWSDEWMVDHENSAAYRTQPDSYSWQPSYVTTDDGEYLFPDSGIEAWLEWATEEPETRCIPRRIIPKDKLTAIGFVQHGDVFEHGWHPGQDADPKVIVKNVRDEMGEDGDIVFWLTEVSQFYIRFECLVRYPNRVYLSSNHFSTDLQLQDVVNYMESVMPDKYAALLKLYPELPRALDTLEDRSAWIDHEEANIDIEFSSWVIGWIEQNTPVMWEDGEPVAILRPWEDDSDD